MFTIFCNLGYFMFYVLIQHKEACVCLGHDLNPNTLIQPIIVSLIKKDTPRPSTNTHQCFLHLLSAAGDLQHHGKRKKIIFVFSCECEYAIFIGCDAKQRLCTMPKWQKFSTELYLWAPCKNIQRDQCCLIHEQMTLELVFFSESKT